MKLVSYIKDDREQLALLVEGILYDTDSLHPDLPSSMNMLLNYWEDYFPLAKKINESIEWGKISLSKGLPLESVKLLPPIPIPASCRKVLVRNHGEKKMPPAFSYCNHHAIQAAGEVLCMPDAFEGLKFEAGISIVIGTHGRNITAEEADQYIGGFLISNLITTTNYLTGDEGSVSHANIREVASIFGPWLVTPDELESFKVDAEEGRAGNKYNLVTAYSINSGDINYSNLSELSYDFAEIIESCSYGADLHAGDIISCSLPGRPGGSIKEGDVIEIEIDGLGISTSTIIAENTDYSLKLNQ